MFFFFHLHSIFILLLNVGQQWYWTIVSMPADMKKEVILGKHDIIAYLILNLSIYTYLRYIYLSYTRNKEVLQVKFTVVPRTLTWFTWKWTAKHWSATFTFAFKRLTVTTSPFWIQEAEVHLTLNKTTFSGITY